MPIISRVSLQKNWAYKYAWKYRPPDSTENTHFILNGGFYCNDGFRHLQKNKDKTTQKIYEKNIQSLGDNEIINV